MAFILNRVFKGFYRDSVFLMRLSRDLGGIDGINEAALMMASPSNKQVLKDAGLFSDQSASAESGDLILAINARDAITAQDAADTIEPQITTQTRATVKNTVWQPKLFARRPRESLRPTLHSFLCPGVLLLQKPEKRSTMGSMS